MHIHDSDTPDEDDDRRLAFREVTGPLRKVEERLLRSSAVIAGSGQGPSIVGPADGPQARVVPESPRLANPLSRKGPVLVRLIRMGQDRDKAVDQQRLITTTEARITQDGRGRTSKPVGRGDPPGGFDSRPPPLEVWYLTCDFAVVDGWRDDPWPRRNTGECEDSPDPVAEREGGTRVIDVAGDRK